MEDRQGEIFVIQYLVIEATERVDSSACDLSAITLLLNGWKETRTKTKLRIATTDDTVSTICTNTLTFN
jgi:hypothetical protein